MKGTFLSNRTFKNKCSNEKIKCLLKEVLYNSLAQAIIKIIQTPHLAIKLFLVVLGNRVHNAILYLWRYNNIENYL